jgi:hypothetical protein
MEGATKWVRDTTPMAFSSNMSCVNLATMFVVDNFACTTEFSIGEQWRSRENIPPDPLQVIDTSSLHTS